MSDVKAVILAGGQGVRFWPVSRQKHPKQFLSINNTGESFIQLTARRVEPLVGPENIVIVGNQLHEDLIRQHVPQAHIISEPVGRNTAPSIGLAALHLRRADSENIMVVLPADHAVKDEECLRRALAEAIKAARHKDVLVTIGIKPSYPHTGFGYLKRGSQLDGNVYELSRFYEKPSLERAKRYVESGEYFWNSGMFVWNVNVILDAIARYMPSLYWALTEIDSVLGSAREAEVVQNVFSSLESGSIDFGVLEHASNCSLVVAEDYGWSDVGSWDAWAEHFAQDDAGNVIQGEAVVIDSRNCLVQSSGRTIAVLGADNLIVIDSGDAVLVCPRSRDQDVRAIVNELKKRGRTDLI